MRLLNTKTLDFKEFSDHTGVQYAILSHRWESGEVTYNDMVNARDLSTYRGYLKIEQCCAQAVADGIDYAWVDTCCIDKSSSAELQEAINSMYAWYKSSKVCYVYLSDFEVDDMDTFAESQWFTRGWTLQELIAPTEVVFYDATWARIGRKKDMSADLSIITRIPRAVLRGSVEDLSEYSIAERMSWANGRKTTRVEDRAYSLLGLFDVNIPLLYGEGAKAFQRLQEEILRVSNDQSILAWPGKEGKTSSTRTYDLLAGSPDDFTRSTTSEAWSHRLDFERRGAHSVTNEGLQVNLLLTPLRPRVYLAVLNYRPSGRATLEMERSEVEGIIVRELKPHGCFIRTPDQALGRVYRGIFPPETEAQFKPRRFELRQITLVKKLFDKRELDLAPWNPNPCFKVLKSHVVVRDNCTTSLDKCHRNPYGQCGTVTVIRMPRLCSAQRSVHVLLGFDFDYCPVFAIWLGADHTQRLPPQEYLQHFQISTFDDITCFEKTGWLELEPNQTWIRRILDYEKDCIFWPFKLIHDRSYAGTCVILMSPRLFSEHKPFLADLRVEIRRSCPHDPWQFSVNEIQGPPKSNNHRSRSESVNRPYFSYRWEESIALEWGTPFTALV